MQKPDKDSKPLRDGVMGLEAGVIDLASAPELRGQALFRIITLACYARGIH